MLGKLLKYEIRATARLFLPMYLVILIFALVNKIFNPFNVLNTSNNFNLQTTLSILSMMIYFALIVGVMVMTLVIMIQRFYKNLLSDEGYLMFTLPVKPWQHILSKLTVSMLWIILSFITIVSSIGILIGISNILAELPRVISTFIDVFGYAGLFSMFLYSVLMLISNVLLIYSAISLGHLFTKHKLLASFGMYCILYTISQILIVVFMLLFAGKPFAYIVSGAPTPAQISTFLLALTPIPIILIAGNFILTNFILKKHLNLE